MACILFSKVRFLKSASRFLAKVLASLVRAFLPGLFFLASFVFSQSQFLAKVSASSQLWHFGKSISFSMAKSGL